MSATQTQGDSNVAVAEHERTDSVRDTSNLSITHDLAPWIRGAETLPAKDYVKAAEKTLRTGFVDLWERLEMRGVNGDDRSGRGGHETLTKNREVIDGVRTGLADLISDLQNPDGLVVKSKSVGDQFGPRRKDLLSQYLEAAVDIASHGDAITLRETKNGQPVPKELGADRFDHTIRSMAEDQINDSSKTIAYRIATHVARREATDDLKGATALVDGALEALDNVASSYDDKEVAQLILSSDVMTAVVALREQVAMAKQSIEPLKFSDDRSIDRVSDQ